jgi:hypothetical protein
MTWLYPARRARCSHHLKSRRRDLLREVVDSQAGIKAFGERAGATHDSASTSHVSLSPGLTVRPAVTPGVGRSCRLAAEW